MQTSNNSQISFRAKFINNTHIKKRTLENVFKPLKTSFIEIEPANVNDINALEKAAYYWVNSFTDNIAYTAKALYKGDLSNNLFKIFALTKQSKKVNPLKTNDILGLAEITQTGKKQIHINYLQVDPQQVYTIKPEFKEIGSRILDSLKELYEKITLTPNSKGTAKFYEKNNFRPQKKQSQSLCLDKIVISSILNYSNI